MLPLSRTLPQFKTIPTPHEYTTACIQLVNKLLTFDNEHFRKCKVDWKTPSITYERRFSEDKTGKVIAIRLRFKSGPEKYQIEDLYEKLLEKCPKLPQVFKEFNSDHKVGIGRDGCPFFDVSPDELLRLSQDKDREVAAEPSSLVEEPSDKMREQQDQEAINNYLSKQVWSPGRSKPFREEITKFIHEIRRTLGNADSEANITNIVEALQKHLEEEYKSATAKRTEVLNRGEAKTAKDTEQIIRGDYFPYLYPIVRHLILLQCAIIDKTGTHYQHALQVYLTALNATIEKEHPYQGTIRPLKWTPNNLFSQQRTDFGPEKTAAYLTTDPTRALQILKDLNNTEDSKLSEWRK